MEDGKRRTKEMIRRRIKKEEEVREVKGKKEDGIRDIMVKRRTRTMKRGGEEGEKRDRSRRNDGEKEENWK